MYRLLKFELPCMERNRMIDVGGGRPVLLIADDGAAYVRKLSTDLVESASFGLDFQEKFPLRFL